MFQFLPYHSRTIVLLILIFLLGKTHSFESLPSSQNTEKGARRKSLVAQIPLLFVASDRPYSSVSQKHKNTKTHKKSKY